MKSAPKTRAPQAAGPYKLPPYVKPQKAGFRERFQLWIVGGLSVLVTIIVMTVLWRVGYTSDRLFGTSQPPTPEISGTLGVLLDSFKADLDNTLTAAASPLATVQTPAPTPTNTLLPTLSPPPTPAPPTATGSAPSVGINVSDRSRNLRDTPSTNGNVIGAIPPNIPFPLFFWLQNEGSDWAFVEYEDQQGYLLMNEAVEVLHPGIPFATLTPTV